MPRINQIRPIYHSTSSNGNRVEWLADNNGESSTAGQLANGHFDNKSFSDLSISDGPSEKGKSKRRFPEEEDEDILRESNDRFVLFPIKYREASLALCLVRNQLTTPDMAGLQGIAS